MAPKPKRKLRKEDKTVQEKKKQLLETGLILPTDWYKQFSDIRIKPILKWFKEGKTDTEVLFLIMEIFKVKESSAQTYLKSAKSCFKQELILERKFNIIQHVKRYDIDILKLSQYEPKTNSYAQTIQLKTEAYLDMLNLLQKKERVLGFHKRAQSIKIKNNININITKVERSFDFSSMTMEEKMNLYKLIEKTKITDEERYILKPNPNKTVDQVIDIEHEEIIETESNAAKIEHIELPPVPLPIIPKPNVGDDKNVIDTVDNTVQSKSFEDIKNNLLSNLLKK